MDVCEFKDLLVGTNSKSQGQELVLVCVCVHARREGPGRHPSHLRGTLIQQVSP